MDETKLSRDYIKNPLKVGEKPTKEDLYYLYVELNWSRIEIAKFIGKSDAQTKRYLAEHKFRKTQEQKAEIRKRTTLEKYGVENVSQLKDIKDKKEQKALEKYGCKNVFQADEIKEKIKQTNLKKYGVKNVAQKPEIYEKIRNTNLLKYGNCSAAASKIIQDKIKNTNLERYGYEVATKSDEIRTKIIKTNYEKYGCISFMQTEEGKNKSAESCFEHYGCRNPMSLKKFKDKIKDAHFKHYNCWSSQRHIPKESLAILSTAENLENYLKTQEKWTTKTLADALGVSISGILKTLKKYKLLKYIDFYTSSYELELQALFPNMHKTRAEIAPYEIDLYSEEHKFGIEFNGNYWHSEIKLPSNYHQKKSLYAESKGIFLYHIWEYEWLDPILRGKIISQIKNLLRENERRIFARKCEIKEVSCNSSREFLNENHIQGYSSDSIRYGLFFEDELVSLMTFGKPRFNKKCEYELIRFCNKKNCSVIGGASRLFKHFLKEYNPKSILSYSHISKGSGKLYEKLGFKLESITDPDYVWCNEEDTLSRYQCQKHKLLKQGFEGSTEREIMENLGFFRVFGCGNKVWRYDK